MSIWNTEETENAIVYRTQLHPGQRRVWKSEKRFIVVLAGTQGGKTSFGPLWLKHEIDRCGSGDYLAGTATFDLFKLKMLPAFTECFETMYELGDYRRSERTFVYHDGKTRIILRSAESKGGFESTTAKAVWLDEAGLRSFTLSIWEGVLRRLSLSQGRVLLTTTIYDLRPGHWLKSMLYDPWLAANRNHPDIDVIQFDSIDNPAFPVDEWHRAEASLPKWRFNMFYRGQYSRPVGLIFDCFERNKHVVPSYTLPEEWNRYLGQDYGGVNMAAVKIAAIHERNADGTWGKETGSFIVYDEYYVTDRKTVADHTRTLMRGHPAFRLAVGGSKSEDNWRREFRRAGLPVVGPKISSVQVGIARVYAMFKRGQLSIMEHCTYLIDQIERYAEEIDADGNIVPGVIDDKTSFHVLDALRAICTRICVDPPVFPNEKDIEDGHV